MVCFEGNYEEEDELDYHSKLVGVFKLSSWVHNLLMNKAIGKLRHFLGHFACVCFFKPLEEVNNVLFVLKVTLAFPLCNIRPPDVQFHTSRPVLVTSSAPK